MRIAPLLALAASALLSACSADGAGPTSQPGDAARPGDGAAPGDAAAPSDAAAPGDLAWAGGLSCAATQTPPNGNPCPAVVGQHGMASFCFRPGWAGVTSVEV